MFTWPNILLWVAAAFLGVALSLALGRLFNARIKERQAGFDELEQARRAKIQQELDDQAADN
jgi:membrane protein DedA with SNARE-associated domain